MAHPTHMRHGPRVWLRHCHYTHSNSITRHAHHNGIPSLSTCCPLNVAWCGFLTNSQISPTCKFKCVYECGYGCGCVIIPFQLHYETIFVLFHQILHRKLSVQLFPPNMLWSSSLWVWLSICSSVSTWCLGLTSEFLVALNEVMRPETTQQWSPYSIYLCHFFFYCSSHKTDRAEQSFVVLASSVQWNSLTFETSRDYFFILFCFFEF